MTKSQILTPPANKQPSSSILLIPECGFHLPAGLWQDWRHPTLPSRHRWASPSSYCRVCFPGPFMLMLFPSLRQSPSLPCGPVWTAVSSSPRLWLCMTNKWLVISFWCQDSATPGPKSRIAPFPIKVRGRQNERKPNVPQDSTWEDVWFSGKNQGVVIRKGVCSGGTKN